MPGIVGLISAGAPVEGGLNLARMLESLRHEPFYVSGSHLCQGSGPALGWMGFDGPAADGMFAQSESTCVLLAGEIFGDLPATPDQSGPGAAARLLQRYEQDGPACLAALNGWFSGVIVDLRRRQTILFNDRYGHGRLYCHRTAGGLHFASETKALLAVFPSLRSLDPQGLAEWMSCGCVLQNRTLFPGILLLPPERGASAPCASCF